MYSKVAAMCMRLRVGPQFELPTSLQIELKPFSIKALRKVLSYHLKSK